MDSGNASVQPSLGVNWKLVEAACCGTISASYAVESFGPQGLFEAEGSAAEGRLEAYLKEKRSGEDSGNRN